MKGLFFLTSGVFIVFFIFRLRKGVLPEEVIWPASLIISLFVVLGLVELAGIVWKWVF